MIVKSQQKSILLTFDFELFLGERSGSVENCLIKPTTELMKIINKFNLSAIFFVDTLYLYQLKKRALTNKIVAEDYNKIIELLRSVIDTGCYVFHHLHPHWLDAKYIEELNEWDVSNKNRFSLINLSENEVEQVFEYSNEIIDEIYLEKRKPIFSGFRAGGLYAQPFIHFRKEMLKHSIRLDFSVLKNAKSTGENNLYGFDYSVFPLEDIYKFSNNIVEKNEEGEFIEIMLDQFKLKGVKKIINGIYYRQNRNKQTWRRWGDGKASGNVSKSTHKTNKFLSEETYSIELLNNYKAHLYYNQIKKENFLQIISHPKLFSPDNISAFERFITKVSEELEFESDVFKILDLHNIVII